MLMLTRGTFLFAAACSIAACLSTNRFAGAGPAAADAASALAFVSAIYNSYATGRREGVWIDSGNKLRRYFEPVLAEAMNKDQENAAKHHEVGELESDPFIDAQDFDIKHFDVAIKDAAPGKVTATVTFDNFGAGDDRARPNRDQKRLADLRYWLSLELEEVSNRVSANQVSGFRETRISEPETKPRNRP